MAQSEMTFRIAPQTDFNTAFRLTVNGGQFEVFASGVIDEGAVARFIAFLRENDIEDAIVLFDSPGGSLSEGIRMGEVIRGLQFNTGIGSYGAEGQRQYKGVCASACAYAFVGGNYRFFSGQEERLGIHQFYRDGDNTGDLGDAQVVSSVLVDYLRRMGIDSRAFLLASTARGDSMHWLSVADARALNLSNNGANETTAEIKLNGSLTYLKLEQDHSDVVSRVLVNCINQRLIFGMGIVTTPEISQMKAAYATKAYVETDRNETIEPDRIKPEGHVLWLLIEPNDTETLALLKANELGFWTENDGPMRWGATMDMRPVREKLLYFGRNCLKGAP